MPLDDFQQFIDSKPAIVITDFFIADNTMVGLTVQPEHVFEWLTNWDNEGENSFYDEIFGTTSVVVVNGIKEGLVLSVRNVIFFIPERNIARLMDLKFCSFLVRHEEDNEFYNFFTVEIDHSILLQQIGIMNYLKKEEVEQQQKIDMEKKERIEKALENITNNAIDDTLDSLDTIVRPETEEDRIKKLMAMTRK